MYVICLVKRLEDVNWTRKSRTLLRKKGGKGNVNQRYMAGDRRVDSNG